MYKTLDIDTWKRKEHYEFFSRMASPYFGIVTEIDCTKAYEKSKINQYSFFAYYLHKSMITVNSIEEFRLRIYENQVVLFGKINAGATIGRDNGTFGFVYIDYSADFETFSNKLQDEIQEVINSTGLRLSGEEQKQ